MEHELSPSRTRISHKYAPRFGKRPILLKFVVTQLPSCKPDFYRLIDVVLAEICHNTMEAL
jgi:hypothetical protein